MDLSLNGGKLGEKNKNREGGGEGARIVLKGLTLPFEEEPFMYMCMYV